MKPGNRTIFKAGHLLRGGDSPLEKDMAVVIEDGVIQDLKPAGEIQARTGDELMEVPEFFLLPGLIDAHNHLSLDSALPGYLERMNDPLPALAIRAAKNLRADLLAGVTTIRCLGDKEFLDIECRKAIASGYLKGPRLVLSGKGIRSSAGHGFVGYPFDGPDKIRSVIRENLSRGAEVVKFYVTGTLPGDGNIQCFFSREEISLIAEEARRAGRKSAVHCIGGVGFDWCLDAGVDVIEHGYFLTDQQIEKLASSGSQLVLTPSFYLSEDRMLALPGPLVEPHLKAADQARAAMKAIVDSGMPYGLGTDGVHGPGNLAAEISCLLELGESPKDALVAATLNGAAICGLQDVTGTLATGKSADIIAVKTNPLEDGAALRDVRLVVSRGEVIKAG